MLDQLTEPELATLRVMLKTRIKNARVNPESGNAWTDIHRYETILSKLTTN